MWGMRYAGERSTSSVRLNSPHYDRMNCTVYTKRLTAVKLAPLTRGQSKIAKCPLRFLPKAYNVSLCIPTLPCLQVCAMLLFHATVHLLLCCTCFLTLLTPYAVLSSLCNSHSYAVRFFRAPHACYSHEAGHVFLLEVRLVGGVQGL